MERLPRAAGILLHPTSLPGEFGIGDLGPSAERFVGFLAETGQTWWQMLPLGPVGAGNSPYQSASSFAGNVLLISPERLVTDGLLDPHDLHDYPRCADDRVAFDTVREAKDRLLRRAFERFPADDADFRGFRERNAWWLDDYSLFVALKTEQGGREWKDWDPPLARREPWALDQARDRLRDAIRFVDFGQYVFDRQWSALRQIGRIHRIRLIGDVPIFVAYDSADVWTRPNLFELESDGRPSNVAGVPPDYFSADGQLWGNPLYRWEAHEAEGYAWWISRLRAVLERVDLVRLDHFRGFAAFWSVPTGSPTAAWGRWVEGPGGGFLSAIREALGGLPLIAEDLGEITPDVVKLRDDFQLPGMKILQFAFSIHTVSDMYLPFSYVPNCVAYTGTHDNDTTVGWYRDRVRELERRRSTEPGLPDYLGRYLGGVPGEGIHWAMNRLALASVADTAILPLQDVLGLGGEARMNVPGDPSGNWSWRCRSGAIDDHARDRLALMTDIYGRWNPGQPRRSGFNEHRA